MGNGVDVGSLVERRKDDAQPAMSCMHILGELPSQQVDCTQRVWLALGVIRETNLFNIFL
jgi:hypothetical protein